MRAITKEEALEWAAQIWARPENETRVMDAEFAKSIAAALYEREIQIFAEIYEESVSAEV